jgi:VanZ family protein
VRKVRTDPQREVHGGAEPVRTWGPAALWAAILFLLSASPDLEAPRWIVIDDKVAHALLYAVLGALLAYGGWRSVRRPAHVALVAVGLLYGASDEWHQAYVPGRHPDWLDWTADGVGVTLGYLAVSLILGKLDAREVVPKGKA